MGDAGHEEAARQLNECDYLFLIDIREPEYLTLQLTIAEAKAQAPRFDTPPEHPLAALLNGGRPIEPDATCRVFRITFERKHMVSYTVVNESYGKYPDAPEQFQGKLFREFSRSYLLEYIAKATIATDDYPGKLRHYQLACQDHVVDVVCTAPPEIVITNAPAPGEADTALRARSSHRR